MGRRVLSEDIRGKSRPGDKEEEKEPVAATQGVFLEGDGEEQRPGRPGSGLLLLSGEPTHSLFELFLFILFWRHETIKFIPK